MGPERFWKVALVRALPLVVVAIFLAESAARKLDAKTNFWKQVKIAASYLRGEDKPLDGYGGEYDGFLHVRESEEYDCGKTDYYFHGVLVPGGHLGCQKGKVIRPEKMSGKKHLFVVGESAAFGFPLKYEATFAGMLGKPLSEQGIDIYNAAQPGTSSSSAAAQARRIVRNFKPTTFIVYAGNSEWIRWHYADDTRTARMAFDIASHSAFLSYLVSRFMSRALQRAPLPIAPFGEPDPSLDSVWTRPPSDWEKTKYSFVERYRDNLVKIIDGAKLAGVRVIILTVPFKYDLSPVEFHPQPISWAPDNHDRIWSALRDIRRMQKQNYHQGALARIEESLEIEPKIARLHYLRAQSLRALGRMREAEQAYALSREYTVGNLGSMVTINNTIREVAKLKGVELLDIQARFDEYNHARGKYFNESLIDDDCHPSARGHRIIADALLPLLKRDL